MGAVLFLKIPTFPLSASLAGPYWPAGYTQHSWCTLRCCGCALHSTDEQIPHPGFHHEGSCVTGVALECRRDESTDWRAFSAEGSAPSPCRGAMGVNSSYQYFMWPCFFFIGGWQLQSAASLTVWAQTPACEKFNPGWATWTHRSLRKRSPIQDNEVTPLLMVQHPMAFPSPTQKPQETSNLEPSLPPPVFVNFSQQIWFFSSEKCWCKVKWLNLRLDRNSRIYHPNKTSIPENQCF